MKDFDSSPPPERQSASRKECILTQKIYDQCRFQDYVRQGPVISGEESECIILHPEIGSNCFGGIVLPGKAVHFPKWVRNVRCADGSFRPGRITVLSITPSSLPGYWNISIEFVFDFKLLLFGKHMTPIQILCCPGDSPISRKRNTKETLACSSSYILQTTLSGPAAEEAFVASDVLPQQNYRSSCSPHVLVEAKAVPENFKLVAPQDAGCFQDLPDDSYHEPFRYVFACIALQADISLFRFVNLAVNAERCDATPPCPRPSTDPCALFQNIEFPESEFNP
jgi:hypothetical protein